LILTFSTAQHRTFCYIFYRTSTALSAFFRRTTPHYLTIERSAVPQYFVFLPHLKLNGAPELYQTYVIAIHIDKIYAHNDW
jgi:hypothetical protein